MNAIEKIEKYILNYVSFEDERLAFLLALWTVAAGTFQTFDAFPYIVITSNTKRSGKTRLSELLGFLSKNTENLSGLTVATLFRMIDSLKKPTLIADESEFLSGESHSPIRAVLNVGYRKGQTVPRVEKGSDDVKHYPTYCPKIFVLIGDVYDTLRDRSIVITMRRGEAKMRFRYDEAKTEGAMLRDEAEEFLKSKGDALSIAYLNIFPEFLSDRDAEIWSPIFCIASVLAPNRVREIEMLAADLCAMKTAEKKRYSTLNMFETEAQNDEYAKKLLLDMLEIFVIKNEAIGPGSEHVVGGALPGTAPTFVYSKKLATIDVVEKLLALPTSPWRKFRGQEITPHIISEMLSRFGVRPCTIRLGSKTAKGYTLDNVLDAISGLNETV